jgi:glycosyltransferase involved in cell wall biosynthesis
MLRENPGKRDQLASGARRRAEQLDWSKVAQQTQTIYESLY